MSGINYPGGSDTFTTPSDPEDTPLSSAGDGTRNLVESIKDLGLAITALEANAAVKGHTHAGGSDGTQILVQAHTHASPDTDTAPTALHHTLGTMPNQAAPGNHAHTYDEIISAPFEVCTSLTRPTSPFVGLHIWEIDTNRWRVWGQFSGSDVEHSGLVWTDNFERVSSTSMGSDWNQTYYPQVETINPDGTAGGLMSIPDGHNVQWDFDYSPYGVGGKGLSWPPSGWPWPYVQGRCIARNVNTVGKHTLTDNQSLSWQAGPTVMPFNEGWPPNPSANDGYLRMSDDESSYIHILWTYTPGAMFVLWLVIIIIVIPIATGAESVHVYATTSGIANEQLIGTLAMPGTDPWSTFQVDAVGYAMQFYNNSKAVGQVIDHDQISAMGASNRGWGIGMTVGRNPGWDSTIHCHPTFVNSVTMRDLAFYTGSPIWQLLPVGVVPILRLRQGVAQQLNHAGSLLTWTIEDEDNFGMFNGANSQTDIIAVEQGMHEIEGTLQMGTDYYPDSGSLVVLLNGEPTEIRAQAATPGFGSGSKGQNAKGGVTSITLPFSGKIRLAPGDVLQIFVTYTSASSLWALIVSYSDPAAKVTSTLKLKWLCP